MKFLVSPEPVGEIDGFLEFAAEGDGDCLFHSLCFLFHQHKTGVLDPQKLRQITLEYLRKIWDPEEWGHDLAYPDPEQYLTALGKAGVYADFNCIRAVARRFRVLIVVHHPFGDPYYAFPSQEPNFTLNLIYRNRNNYNPLVPKSSALPAAKAVSGKGLKKPGPQGRAKRKIFVELRRSNRKDEVSCACQLAAMPAEPFEVPVYDEEYKEVASVPIRYCVYTHLTEKPFYYVQPSSDEIFPWLLQSKQPRFDWYSGSFGKSGRLLGCHDTYFHKLLGFEEQCYYSQRALFGSNVAGCSGRIEVLRAPLEATAKLTNGVKIQVHDGWGYIKSCLAEQLKQTLVVDEVELDRPSANFGMFQWLRAMTKEDTVLEAKVVDELFQALRSKLGKEKEKSKLATPKSGWARALIDEDPSMARHPFLVEKVLQEGVRRALRRITTADPELWGGIAMPVSSGALVLPHPDTCERMKDFTAKKVAVFRNPGDSLNWVCTENVDRTSGLSKLIAAMESVQYTLTGKEDGKLGFYKGMAGVIPDNLWPKAWKGVSMVVCNADRKASETWKKQTDPDTAKKSEESARFSMEGCLVVLQWFQAGSCVGVPYDTIQQKLAGDYDGDQAVLLSGDEFPETYAYIERMLQREKEATSSGAKNPKLTKTSTPIAPGESRASCIRKIQAGSQLAGAWSNLAARLLSVDPTQLDAIAKDLEYESGDALLRRVSLGIKQGTDAFKTSVDVDESNQEATLIREELTSRGITAPHTKLKYETDLFRDRSHIPPVLTEDGEKPQDAWKSKFAIGSWMKGIPAALMRKVIPELSALTAPEPGELEDYQAYVEAPGEEELETVSWIGGSYKDLLTRYPTGGDAFVREWQACVQGLRRTVPVERLAELVWWALHDSRNLPSGAEPWRLAQGAFHQFHDHIQRIVENRPKEELPTSLDLSGEEDIEDAEYDLGGEPVLVDRGFYNTFDDDFDDDDVG
ncbi:MAG TPA: hypothetical protein VN493_24595 [Thermoanaerobaculia bacterium]|nr:hypothetical protein [Thermoanaerobaculia bacterium]